MKRLNKKRVKSLNNKILICLIAMLCFNLVFSSLSANADSNDRISVFINLASGKQTTDLNIDKLNLSERDLQFLGVYVSNFFVPFGTELGISGDDTDGVINSNKENIKKALQTNINFSDALASSLTESLLGLSRNSVKELSLCVSNEYQKDLVPVPDLPLNYYTALCLMLGGFDKIIDKYDDKNNIIKNIKDDKYKYGYFAYMKDGKYIPVFDFDLDMSSITPSVASFIKVLESTDIESGYGFNFFDFTKKEMGTSEGDYEDKSKNLTNAEIYKMSIYGSKLAVDCFGNIIIMGGNHQYIAVPGAMNPYTWVEVDNSGKSKGEGLGGTFYNIANIPSMSLQDNKGTGENDNRLFFSFQTQVSNKDAVKSSNSSDIEKIVGLLETKILVKKLSKVADDEDDGEYAFRKVRGSSDYSLNSGLADWVGFDSDYRNLAKMAEEGFKEANPKAKNYFGIKDGITSIDSSCICIYGFSPSKWSQISSVRQIKIIDSFAYIDNLGAAHFDDSGEKLDFSTFNIEHYLSDSESIKSLKDSMASWGGSSDNGFTNTYKNIEQGVMSIPSNVSKEAMVGLYVTYAFSSLYDDTSSSAKEATIGKLGYKLNSANLPSIPDNPLTLSSDAQSDIMLSSIRDWTYYLLHPTEGLTYFKTWVNSKLNSFLIGWHDDMVGTNGTGSINGTTNYRGTSGYVTTPDLSDIPWVDSLIDFYKKLSPFLIVFMVIIMLGAYVVGVLSFQKALVGFLIFALVINLPVPIINGVVGTSNRLASNLYGEKFTYWALVQHESYSGAIDEASSGNSYSNYLKTLYETNAQATGNQGKESIMLKWQAPKKMSSLMLTSKDKEALNGFSSSKLLGGLINSTYSGENYLKDEDSVYLYRSYIDIANFSRYIHRGLSGSTPKQPINMNLTSDITNTWSESLRSSISDYSSRYESDRSLGYANINGNGSSDGTNVNILRVRLPLSSGIVSEAYGNSVKEDMSLDDYVGINQDAFNFSIPMFNVESLDYYSELKTDAFNPENYSREDFSALASYGLMSENPFYYFSWYLYETGLSTDSGSYNGYKNLLLGEDNAGFFYNTKGNGELKDFMDMRSLFTYIIPYLKQGNDIVKDWDETYGIFVYDGIPTEEGHQNDADIKSNPELRQKYWHNLNVARLYNIYCPWVDVMYDCSYAKSEKIDFLGESYVVEDPINPSSYPSDRPMIFSKSEMIDYGLNENQLTKVEKLILKCEEGMQERMFNLLNYYSFNDVVLNTASAINCAFEFNTTFSENSIVGNNHNIYPQSFELNDFSYDAFLRFILSSSTGESMLVKEGGNFYSNIVTKSSLTTTIVLLVLDVLSVYLLPALKIFFIVGMFVMSILVILLSVFKVDPEYKFIKKLMSSLINPMIRFLVINCGMALILSLFMGEGNTAVTGSSKVTISLGDPVMVMLIMILLNGIVIYLLWKLLYNVLQDIKQSGKLVGNFMLGVAGSVGSVAVSSVLGNAYKKSNFGSSSSSDSSSNTNIRTRRGTGANYVEHNKDKEIRKVDRSKTRINKSDKKPRNDNGRSIKSNINSKIESGLDKIKNSSSDIKENINTKIDEGLNSIKKAPNKEETNKDN